MTKLEKGWLYEKADTGLLVSLAFGANPKAVEDAHRRIMFDSLSFNEGMLIENAVAQMLAAQGLDLFFYPRASSGILRLPLYMTPWIDWR